MSIRFSGHRILCHAGSWSWGEGCSGVRLRQAWAVPTAVAVAFGCVATDPGQQLSFYHLGQLVGTTWGSLVTGHSLSPLQIDQMCGRECYVYTCVNIVCVHLNV